MFHKKLNVVQYGTWERRTVWQFKEAMPWSVWNRFIYSSCPLNFYSDFASVPRHFHMYDLFGGICNAPASSHDLVYRKDAMIFVDLDILPDNIDEFPSEAVKWIQQLQDSGWYQNFPKELADYIFRQLMIEDGESVGVYEPMYLAVKAAGGSSFHKFNVVDKLPCERIYQIEEW